MLSRLHLFIVFCLSSTAALAADNSDAVPGTTAAVDVAESPAQVSAQQEEARRQVVSEEEDPQVQKTLEHQEETEKLIELERKTGPASE